MRESVCRRRRCLALLLPRLPQCLHAGEIGVDPCHRPQCRMRVLCLTGGVRLRVRAIGGTLPAAVGLRRFPIALSGGYRASVRVALVSCTKQLLSVRVIPTATSALPPPAKLVGAHPTGAHRVGRQPVSSLPLQQAKTLPSKCPTVPSECQCHSRCTQRHARTIVAPYLASTPAHRHCAVLLSVLRRKVADHRQPVELLSELLDVPTEMASDRTNGRGNSARCRPAHERRAVNAECPRSDPGAHELSLRLLVHPVIFPLGRLTWHERVTCILHRNTLSMHRLRRLHRP